MSAPGSQAKDRRGALGLYVHVPFCASLCPYCHFTRGVHDAALARAYVDALLTQIAREADGSTIDTVYFGGGTPSLLPPAAIARVMGAIADGFALDPGAEVTLEANPETVDADLLAAFRAAGVTRLSLGVQSFVDEDLARIGRCHDARRARQAIEAARRAGLDDVNVDLMLWLPGQAHDDWRASVSALLEVAPEHASLYLLELHPTAPLRETMARCGWSQAPDDEAADMYLEAMQRLDDAGLTQYEISSAARAGHQCRHNRKYWEDGEWLALGCAAHGTRGRVRWRNVASTVAYIERVRAGADVRAEVRRLSPEEAAVEALIMGLRLADGVDVADIARRYAVDPATRHLVTLQPAIDAGLLEIAGTRWRLTRQGMLLSSEILRVFV